ncbi:MAG: SDR family oxidoreductase [Acetobacteraceae bacterium]|nr:SDR family oxidoreductase [Acetobacteraceae bacterium]
MSAAPLAGTVSFVMGASVGIGAAVAETLVAQGASVAIAARRWDELRALAARLGPKVMPLACDVADHAAVKTAVDAAAAHFGRLDHLVNNAGVIEPIGRVDQTDPVQWARAIQVNLVGAYHAIHACLPHLLATRGVIVNVSSGAAHRPLEGWGSYCASKAGLAMLGRSLMLEYGTLGLRVYGFAPGGVRTAMQEKIRASGLNPVSRILPQDHLPPELPAQVIAWLCRAEAADYPQGECSIRDAALCQRAGITLPG